MLKIFTAGPSSSSSSASSGTAQEDVLAGLLEELGARPSISSGSSPKGVNLLLRFMSMATGAAGLLTAALGLSSGSSRNMVEEIHIKAECMNFNKIVPT